MRGEAYSGGSEFERGLDHAAPGAGASIEVVVVVIDPEDSRGNGDVVANLVLIVNLIHVAWSLLARGGSIRASYVLWRANCKACLITLDKDILPVETNHP